MENFELDDRMTEETKFFVTNSLKNLKPADVVNLDINMCRRIRVVSAHQVNSSLKFESLKEKELKIRNKNDDYEIPVSVYTPQSVKPNSPITIFYHGGGWTFGSRESFFYTIATLVESTNTIWISVEYRLCPENKFPIPLTDCQSVLEYVSENKQLFSSENSKLGICGDSSGGHYCALLSNEFNNLIDYQILIYPVVSFSNSYESEKEFTKDCYILVPEVIEFFAKNLLTDASLAHTDVLSPILKEDFSKLPNTLIIAAELDPVVDHSKHYYKRLQENNVKSVLKIINGVHHGFFNHPVLMKNAFNEMKDQITQFFQSF